VKIPFMIAVSGGKGGTGKTFVATNLAISLVRDYKVLLVDADVDNPNVSLLMSVDLPVDSVKISSFIPVIDDDKCKKCGTCADNCRFHALFQMSGKSPVLLEHLCKACKLCMRICPADAITPGTVTIGERFFMENIRPGLDLIVGRLIPGKAKSTPLIAAIKDYMYERVLENSGYDLVIIDTSPGAHCDVEHAIDGADLVICVTEPTPLGSHDLDRILELCKFIGIPAAVIINRFDIVGDTGGVQKVAEKFKVPIIGKIPLSTEAMKSYAKGVPIMEHRLERDSTDPVVNAFKDIIGVISEKW